ncbi:MAG: ABC transporter permease [Peptoniphilus harei]|uniref:FtsX-like permease family protein n=2 Tax=Peptoniphilus lacydonensis TaxID=1673725 RepID=UPI00290B7767|nr:FtsX-like permease family protein [Peptoniphilus lacydonensis]MBS6611440.1 ABC transporter permease [Peptoniphilus harei]MDU5436742.1 FtsX-like permease family protein [Peptoniphilus lacydonensis]
MKIINDLADGAVKNNKKDSFSIKISILLAVILLGTVIFIFNAMRTEQYNYVKKNVGDYHVSISEIDEKLYDKLINDEDIEKISFNKIIETDLNATIYEFGDSTGLIGFDIKEGRKPNNSNEILVPEKFLIKSKEYDLGSEITVRDKTYKVVGVYDDYSKSFEESMLIGLTESDDKKGLFEKNDEIEAQIWYKNIRDTYTKTREVLSEMNIEENHALDIGRVFYNKDILEYKMVYPKGIIPPKSVVNLAIEKYGAGFFLCLLFAFIIYGSFNVWNNRDLKEIALLKSTGMTDKQVKKMIRKKAFKLSTLPIALGTILSLAFANLLLYLMWLNNSISYKNMSEILGESLKSPGFYFVYPNPISIIMIILLSILTVYLSAIIPARKSAKIKIIEGLNGITEKNIKLGKSKINGPIEKTLAKDYYRSYRSTYRIIVISMALSAFVLTAVLVSQSYRTLNKKYNSYKSPYNFNSSIYTDKNLDENLLADLEKVDGIKELHLYQRNDTKFYLDDNKDFISKDLKNSLDSGKIAKDRLYASLYALTDEDFEKILKENNIPNASYLLLNKIRKDSRTPYAFSEYIKISDKDTGKVTLKYNAQGKPINIKIDASIDEMPYDLEAYDNNEIPIYTSTSNMKKFIDEYGIDKSDPVYYYFVKIKAEKNKEKVFEDAEKVISNYVPKSDHGTATEILREAVSKEQTRNERLLNLAIQIILITIALSNAYNSFKGNLRARSNDFKLLSTAGMKEKQMEKMVFGEGKILFKNIFLAYIFMFIIGIALRAYRSNYELAFAIKGLITNMNYIPLIVVFVFMIAGVLFAIKSGFKTINENSDNTFKSI